MIQFKEYLLESQKKIDFNLQKYPEHANFINSFLGDNRHVRSKYLEWAIKNNNNSSVTPDRLGAAVDIFHTTKSKPNVTFNKDINKYRSHSELVDTIDKHINKEPISDKESTYSHPDNKVLFNNGGYKLTKIGSYDAMTHTRKHFDNSWCVAQRESHYKAYPNLHLHEMRHPENGKIYRFLSGHFTGEEEISTKENLHFRQEDDGDGIIQNNSMLSNLYHNGPTHVKDNIRFAPENVAVEESKRLPKNTSSKDLSHLSNFNNTEIHNNLLDHIIQHKSIIDNNDADHYDEHLFSTINNIAKNPDMKQKILDSNNKHLIRRSAESLISNTSNEQEHHVLNSLLDKLGHNIPYEIHQKYIPHTDLHAKFLQNYINSPKQQKYISRELLNHIATNPDHYDDVIKFIKSSSYNLTRNSPLDIISKDPTYPVKSLLSLGFDRLTPEAVKNMIKYHPQDTIPAFKSYIRNKKGANVSNTLYHLAQHPELHKELEYFKDVTPEHSFPFHTYAEHTTNHEFLSNVFRNAGEQRTRMDILEGLMRNKNEKFISNFINSHNITDRDSSFIPASLMYKHTKDPETRKMYLDKILKGGWASISDENVENLVSGNMPNEHIHQLLKHPDLSDYSKELLKTKIKTNDQTKRQPSITNVPNQKISSQQPNIEQTPKKIGLLRRLIGLK